MESKVAKEAEQALVEATPGESALLLLDVVDALITQDIDYAVIGALAASIHGVVRASMDADVVLSVSVQKANDLERGFTVAVFQTELTRGDFEDPVPDLLKGSDVHVDRVDPLLGLRGTEPDAFLTD